jgi:hypothetical protein
MEFRKSILAVLATLLIFSLQESSSQAAGENWLQRCPPVIDKASNSDQPRTNKFTFTGTQQVFLKINPTTGKEISEETTIIGCYADFGGLNGATPNGYHVGSISRDLNGFYWTNAAGISWRLTLDSSREFLITNDQNPYQEFGDRFVIVEVMSGINLRGRGAFGMSPEPKSDTYSSAWISTQEFSLPPLENSYGFSFYTSVWPLFKENVKNISASAGVTWIYPRTDDLTQSEKNSLCSFSFGMQSMEGGIAWAWDQFKFPTILPKYKLNPVADCYGSDAPNTPFWSFTGGQLPKDKLSTLLISNQILVAPDGFAFEESSAGGMLGVATMAVPFKLLTPQADRETGEQSWMVLLNTTNFKGPIAIYPAQLFSSFGKGNALRKKVAFDRGSGFLTSAALEWGGMPFVEYRDKDGSIYSKIPPMQFPSDFFGETIVMSDFKSYSKVGFYNDFGRALESKGEIPTRVDLKNSVPIRIKAPTYPLFQSGKQINPFPDGTLTELDNGNAFGFKWNKSAQVISLPTIFKQVGDYRIKTDLELVPEELRSHSFLEPARPSYSYETPSWWNQSNSTKSQKVEISDGSTVEYVWVRFVDQPGIHALNLYDVEKTKLQEFVVDLHKSWNNQNEFLTGPSRGKLAAFDRSLLVSPPSGMEFGFVPLVISQTGTPKTRVDSGLLNSPSSLYQKELKEFSAAQQEAEARAAAELKAKYEAEAKIAAELKAKLKAEAEALAAAAKSKKTTITCVKSKITKKVTAVKPKCPNGYKRK